MKGRVTSVLLDRGFGFLRGEDGLSRFFLAREVKPAGIFDTLREGHIVTFNPSIAPVKGDGNNGLRAEEVRLDS